MLWQRRVERLEEDAEDIRSDGKEHEAFINALATNIHAFLQENKEPLAEHGLSHIMMSTSDFLKRLDQSACEALDEQVGKCKTMFITATKPSNICDHLQSARDSSCIFIISKYNGLTAF